MELRRGERVVISVKIYIHQARGNEPMGRVLLHVRLQNTRGER